MTTLLQVRVSKKDFDVFEQKCRRGYNVKHTDMIRDIVTAFNEGRLKIKPSENEKNFMEDIYYND